MDPDGTAPVTKKKNGSDGVLLSSNELHEEWGEYEDEDEEEDEEMSTLAPAIAEGSRPNRTGNLHHFSSAH